MPHLVRCGPRHSQRARRRPSVRPLVDRVGRGESGGWATWLARRVLVLAPSMRTYVRVQAAAAVSVSRSCVSRNATRFSTRARSENRKIRSEPTPRSKPRGFSPCPTRAGVGENLEKTTGAACERWWCAWLGAAFVARVPRWAAFGPSRRVWSASPTVSGGDEASVRGGIGVALG